MGFDAVPKGFVQSTSKRAPKRAGTAASSPSPDSHRTFLLRTLEQLMLSISGPGQEFFRSLVKNLASATQAKHVLLGEVKPDAPDMVRTLAVWSGEDFADNFEYALRGTPCESVISQRACYYPSGIQQAFPEDLILVDMGVHSYLGVPLPNREGNNIGLLVLLNDRPLPEPEVARLFVEVCAMVAAAQVEVRQEHKISRAAQKWMRGIFRQALDGVQDHAVFQLDLHGNIAGWNASAARVYGYNDNEILKRPINLLWPQPQRAVELLERARTSGTVEIQENQSRKSGRIFLANVRLQLFHGMNGKPLGFVCVTRDLTYPTVQEQGRHIVEMLAFREPLDRILAALAGTLEMVFPDAHCAIMLSSRDGKKLTCAAAPSLPRGFIELLESLPVEGQGSWCATAVSRRHAVTSSNFALDMLWPELRETALSHDLRACWSTPILSATGGVLGTVDLYYPRMFLPGETDVQIIDRVVGAASVAIQRTLNDQAKAEAERQRLHLMQDVISAEEEERRRVARELHDGTAQTLTSLLLRLRALQHNPVAKEFEQELDRLRCLTSDTLTDLRHILHGLYPSALDDFGLAPALERYATEAGKMAKVKVNFFSEGMANGRLPRTVEAAVYRAAQEAVNNAVKHAQAKNIQVFVKQERNGLRVAVSDDGVGFNLKDALKPAATEQRLGLAGMRHRMEMLGGSVDIETRAGGGTTVSLHIPKLDSPELA
ncbi:MAG TPA: GAF domain-containing protein [Candidatus Angelobacter sp.]